MKTILWSSLKTLKECKHQLPFMSLTKDVAFVELLFPPIQIKCSPQINWTTIALIDKIPVAFNKEFSPPWRHWRRVYFIILQKQKEGSSFIYWQNHQFHDNDVGTLCWSEINCIDWEISQRNHIKLRGYSKNFHHCFQSL